MYDRIPGPKQHWTMTVLELVMIFGVFIGMGLLAKEIIKNPPEPRYKINKQTNP